MNLFNSWSFWVNKNNEQWHPIYLGTADTVEMFWRYYNNIHVKAHCATLMLNKKDVSPYVEQYPGSVRMTWSVSSLQAPTVMLHLMLDVIGCDMPHFESVFGCSLAVRKQRNSAVAIWISDNEHCESIRSFIEREFGLVECRMKQI